MKSFNEWLLVEMKVKCLDCGSEQGVSRFDYNAGKARCRNCGGSTEPMAAKSDKITDAKRRAAANADAMRPSAYGRRGNSN